jgi:predicted PurR-regulated permease PerM
MGVAAVGIFVLFVLLPHLWPAVAAGFLTLIFATIIDLPVGLLRKLHIPRPVGVVLSIVGFLSTLGVMGFFIAPALTSDLSKLGHQSKSLTALLANRINSLTQFLPIKLPRITPSTLTFGHLSQYLNAGAIIHTTSIVVLVVGVSVAAAAWAVATPQALLVRIQAFFPEKHHESIVRILAELFVRLRRWVVGQLALNVYVFGTSYILFRLLSVPFAGFFAILAGTLELIPSFGLILGALPPAMLLFVRNPSSLILFLAGVLIIHQLEDRFIIPIIMRKAVNIHQSIITLILFSFALLWGPAGAILAVPIVGTIFALIDELRAIKSEFKDSE